MTSLPRFSIITPTLNRATMIVDAIDSVLDNNYPNIEHVIVDGGSTDGTLDVLAQYQNLKVISSPDQGMYDALNKGLELSTGEIIGFLNSDDVYEHGAFHEVARAFQNVEILAAVGEAIVHSKTANGEKQIITSFNPTSASLLEFSTLGSPFMNAWFFRKELFEKIGNFNSTYRIVADRDFMLRLALSGIEYTTLTTLIYKYLHHSDATTFDITDQKFEKIVKEHLVMTSSYLQLENLSKPARQLIRKLRTRDTIEMVIRSIKLKKFYRCAHYIFEGLRYDWRWPVQFGDVFFHAVIYKIAS